MRSLHILQEYVNGHKCCSLSTKIVQRQGDLPSQSREISVTSQLRGQVTQNVHSREALVLGPLVLQLGIISAFQVKSLSEIKQPYERSGIQMLSTLLSRLRTLSLTSLFWLPSVFSMQWAEETGEMSSRIPSGSRKLFREVRES